MISVRLEPQQARPRIEHTLLVDKLHLETAHSKTLGDMLMFGIFLFSLRLSISSSMASKSAWNAFHFATKSSSRSGTIPLKRWV